LKITWHPIADVVVTVDEPGRGYLTAELRPSSGEPGSGPRVAGGQQLGETLRSLTELALSDDADEPGNVNGLWWMSHLDARRLLPAIQEAALYAVAGAERTMRVWEPPVTGAAWEPMCGRCGVHLSSVPKPSDAVWCGEHGHSPFGDPRQQVVD
jgi:hypothetical protein